MLDFLQNKNIKPLLTVLITAVILLLVIFWASGKAQKKAQSEFIVKNSQEMLEGLENFYRDQNRFPTVLEYEDRAIVGGYFNEYPPISVPSGTCSQTFVYKRIDSRHFQLNFCIPSDALGYKKGWNSLSVKK